MQELNLQRDFIGVSRKKNLTVLKHKPLLPFGIFNIVYIDFETAPGPIAG